VSGPEPAPDHWFEALADHLGGAYLRYSFTRGTTNEVDFLIEALGLTAGQRVLDVGCGPGRHARALAARGFEVLGVDISHRFIDLARHDAPPGARFERLDARELPFDDEFDAVISLCQGAFGLAGHDPEPHGRRAGPQRDPDGVILGGMARALHPGGRLAVSAFSAYFQVRYLETTDVFDAERGVNHEQTVIKDEAGHDATHDLWTSCFTPRELRLLAREAGLVTEALWSVTPGAYAANPPDLDHPEYLLVARRELAGGG
jgi:SAM-dependent methyltransferase